MDETTETTGANWSDLLGFYEHAKSYFAACKFREDSPDFLYLLLDRVKADYGVVIINNGEDELHVMDQEAAWQRSMGDLVEELPLLFHSHSCERIAPNKIDAMVTSIGMPQAIQAVDGAFFALELNDQSSLMLVLFRKAESGPFNDAEYSNLQSVAGLLEQLVTLSLMVGQGDEMSEKLRNHHKRESIWLESLAWLNEMGSSEFNKEQLLEFYTTAIFQMKLLVTAQNAVAFRRNQKDGSLQVIQDQEDPAFIEHMQGYVETCIGEESFTRNKHYKLRKGQDAVLENLDDVEVLVYPLYTRKDLRMVLCVGRQHNNFEDHEEMVATLFAEGIEHIIERVFFVRAIRHHNKMLQREKEEQNKLIAQLSEAQDQLLQQEKMASIGQLAAGVAHEINNPVGYVNSNINSMENYVNDLFDLLQVYAKIESELPEDHAVKKEIKEFKQEIDFDFIQDDVRDLISESKEGVVRVKQIVKDLKDFSHVDEAEWQWADLVKGMDSTLNIVHNEIKYKAEIVKEYEDIPQVECVPSQINQVVMNLLVNASHAIEERGTITMRTRRLDEKHVCIEVQDTGKGISPENLSKIFDPFFTTKPVGKGTGLGLSLSYSIAEKHGGELSAESEVGVGTTFRITLPIEQEERKADQEASGAISA